MAKKDRRGRIMEGPTGGQWTSAKRPNVEALNCKIDRRGKKRKR